MRIYVRRACRLRRLAVSEYLYVLLENMMRSKNGGDDHIVEKVLLSHREVPAGYVVLQTVFALTWGFYSKDGICCIVNPRYVSSFSPMHIKFTLPFTQTSRLG